MKPKHILLFTIAYLFIQATSIYLTRQYRLAHIANSNQVVILKLFNPSGLTTGVSYYCKTHSDTVIIFANPDTPNAPQYQAEFNMLQGDSLFIRANRLFAVVPYVQILTASDTGVK